MSKQKRNLSQKAKTSSSKSSERSPSVASSQSNQAVLDQLETSGSAGAERGGTDAVRAVALPLVERGIFALNTSPREAGVVQKYVEVLASSKLPSDRKALLINKLQNDQESALAAHEAANRHFGEGGVETGHAVLSRVWEGLSAEGAAAPAGDNLSERAERWVERLAGAELGPAAAAFCREVHLMLALEEEEEEGFGPMNLTEMD